MPPGWNKLIAEFFGTFCLVFAGCGAMAVNEVMPNAIGHAGIALTWGLIVIAMIYALGDVSGAHINPAVTLGFWAKRCIPFKTVPPYLAAQSIGAIAAAGALRLLFPTSETLGATLPHDPAMAWQSFGLEVLLTLVLMMVILCVATGPKESGMMAGLAIGATVGLEAMFAGPVCGASMNPARSLGPALVSADGRAIGSLWIYLLATPIGALLAVPLFRLVKPGQADPAACCGGSAS